MIQCSHTVPCPYASNLQIWHYLLPGYANMLCSLPSFWSFYRDWPVSTTLGVGKRRPTGNFRRPLKSGLRSFPRRVPEQRLLIKPRMCDAKITSPYPKYTPGVLHVNNTYSLQTLHYTKTGISQCLEFEAAQSCYIFQRWMVTRMIKTFYHSSFTWFSFWILRTCHGYQLRK